MNIEDLIWRIKNEPEWVVVISLVIFLVGGGGYFFYSQSVQAQQEAVQTFNQGFVQFSYAKRNGNYNNALSQFNKVVSQYPDSEVADKALYFLGKGYFETEEYLEAMRRFQQLLEVYPRSSFVDSARLHLAYASMEQEQYQKALEYLNGFKNISPEDPIWSEVIWNKALIQIRLDNNASAQRMLTRIINESTSDDTYWVDKAKQLKNTLAS